MERKIASPQLLISPAQFQIIPLYEGPAPDNATRPKPEAMCRTSNTASGESTVVPTENAVTNTEPQAGQFIRKSLLVSDLIGQTFNPAVGSADVVPVVLAQDADETTTRSRFRKLLDWPLWTSSIWATIGGDILWVQQKRPSPGPEPIYNLEFQLQDFAGFMEIHAPEKQMLRSFQPRIHTDSHGCRLRLPFPIKRGWTSEILKIRTRR